MQRIGLDRVDNVAGAPLHQKRQRPQDQSAQQRHDQQAAGANPDAFAEIMIGGNAEIIDMQPGDAFAQEVHRRADQAAENGADKDLPGLGVAQTALRAQQSKPQPSQKGGNVLGAVGDRHR